MNIQEQLRGLIPYKEESYPIFAKTLNDAYVELSFWGSRDVYSTEYSGSIPLQELAEKVRELVDSFPEFSEEERKFGTIIQNKVLTLYDISSEEEKQVGLIRTCIFGVIECFTSRSSRLYDAILEATPFDYCTAKQYEEIFGESPVGFPVGEFRKKEYPKNHVPIWHYHD